MFKLQESTNSKISKLATSPDLIYNQQCGICRKQITKFWFLRELAIFICQECCTKFRGFSSAHSSVPFINVPHDIADDTMALVDYKIVEAFGNKSFFETIGKVKWSRNMKGEAMVIDKETFEYNIEEDPNNKQNEILVQITKLNGKDVHHEEISFNCTIPTGQLDLTPEIEFNVYRAWKKIVDAQYKDDKHMNAKDIPITPKDIAFVDGKYKDRLLNLMRKECTNEKGQTVINNKYIQQIYGYAEMIAKYREKYILTEHKTNEMRTFVTNEALNSNIGIAIMTLSFTILMIYFSKNYKKPEGFITLVVSISAFIISRTIRYNQDKIEIETAKMWSIALKDKN